jgi:hypothetical protein
MVLHGWGRLTSAFLVQISYLADIHEIQAELLINLDQTVVPLMPASNYTRATKGSKWRQVQAMMTNGRLLCCANIVCNRGDASTGESCELFFPNALFKLRLHFIASKRPAMLFL